VSRTRRGGGCAHCCLRVLFPACSEPRPWKSSRRTRLRLRRVDAHMSTMESPNTNFKDFCEETSIYRWHQHCQRQGSSGLTQGWQELPCRKRQSGGGHNRCPHRPLQPPHSVLSIPSRPRSRTQGIFHLELNSSIMSTLKSRFSSVVLTSIVTQGRCPLGRLFGSRFHVPPQSAHRSVGSVITVRKV
jgi:hypothetical protein